MKASSLKLVIAPLAPNAVAEQAAYYREKLGDTLAARWMNSADRAIQSLRTMPERGPSVLMSSASLTGLRSLHVEKFPKHLIFYTYNATKGLVHVISVVHGARDLEDGFVKNTMSV